MFGGNMLIQSIAIILLVALDQFTKFITVNHLQAYGDAVQIIDGVIEFKYIKNTGAAFGMLDNGTLILSVLVSVVVVLIIVFQRKIPRNKHYLPIHVLITFILAGAIGNLIDRIRLQYVVDMIHFYWFEFPIFNVADIYVTCSAFILMILLFTKYKNLEF